jgi:hypothetical protein
MAHGRFAVRGRSCGPGIGADRGHGHLAGRSLGLGQAGLAKAGMQALGPVIAELAGT